MKLFFIAFALLSSTLAFSENYYQALPASCRPESLPYFNPDWGPEPGTTCLCRVIDSEGRLDTHFEIACYAVRCSQWEPAYRPKKACHLP